MSIHRFDVTPAQARQIQEELRGRVELVDRFGPIARVAGVDVSHRRFAPHLHVAAVVLSYPSLELLEVATATIRAGFPYVPGLLAFREIPPILEALAALSRPADLIVVDGQGLAHPRRFGLACHLGVHLDIPTIGCAKSLYVGEPAALLGDRPGDRVDLIDRGETVGAALRTRPGSRPIYVSPGHRVSLATAVAIARSLGDGHRLPVPTRLAHVEANRTRREHETRPPADAGAGSALP